MEGIEILQPELAVNGICWHPVSKGERKLLKAVARGDLDKVRIVLGSSLKCSVNSVNNSGKTVLQIASELIESTVRNDMINLLLHGGADLELALLHAVRESDVRGVEILLQFHNPSSPKRISPDISGFNELQPSIQQERQHQYRTQIPQPNRLKFP